MAGAEAEAGSTPAIVAAIFFFAGLSGLGACDLDGLGDFGGFGNLAVIFWSQLSVCGLSRLTLRHLDAIWGRERHSITSLYFIALRLY